MVGCQIVFLPMPVSGGTCSNFTFCLRHCALDNRSRNYGTLLSQERHHSCDLLPIPASQLLDGGALRCQERSEFIAGNTRQILDEPVTRCAGCSTTASSRQCHCVVCWQCRRRASCCVSQR